MGSPFLIRNYIISYNDRKEVRIMFTFISVLFSTLMGMALTAFGVIVAAVSFIYLLWPLVLLLVVVMLIGYFAGKKKGRLMNKKNEDEDEDDDEDEDEED